ncbi:MmcQ/YjbR family DNA-binding protein [Nannocystis sp. SCPEA4]|uniref:MmcQ/YjbR family DNA-binding protein n=1 Tax=Nannocystis sp. SCPEA4 TaxID=2996787 RepID=UPI002271A734|nr:MmcQ/YjbR family DNA-binding protein [Nannocystis sp. SCPEA4]MCY1059347.1 MmcQ/YjbR family DNA-binding protein [Nannocystis sp. SCPEA4]
MISAARFREIALAFEGATEVPHMDRAAFRTKRRIFATLPPDAATANLMLERDLQEALCEAKPKAFAPVPGGWGRMGYTTVNLRAVSEPDLIAALTEAHARASEPKKKPAAKRARQR